MMNSLFEDLEIVNELATFDVLEDDVEPAVSVPRFRNVYLGGIIDPYTFYDEEGFVNRYRFSKRTVTEVILPLLGRLPQPTNLRGQPILPQLQILVALRYYATGSFQVVCGDLHFVSQPTVSRIVQNVSENLAELVDQFVKFPTELGTEFESAQNRYPPLRHIRGAIDCTHIKIRRPRGIIHTEAYRNRKGTFTINCQCVVGMNMKIYNIVARWPGSSHDSRIFRSSKLHAQFETGELDGILVGDSGYRATTYMLTPINNPTSPAQIRYNYVQVRTRNVVERFYGVWKRTFPCLQVGINTKLTTASNIIVACAVLHNIRVQENEIEEEEFSVMEEPPHSIVSPPNTASGLAFRNSIVETIYNY